MKTTTRNYNKKPEFKRTTIALCMATIFSGASMPVLAAEAEVDKGDIEVIEVKGIRGSLAASLNTKRFSTSIVDAITSEDIGKFPDKNIGDALQRISGVMVERAYGEVSGVSIRGTAPEQSKILLNGQTVASTGWDDLATATRTFNMELLSAEQVSAVEVYKSPEARLEEGALGGTVDLSTRKPFDLEQHTYMVSGEVSRSSLYEENDPGAAFLGSWKNDNETFGILAAYSFEKITTGRHKLESLSPYAQMLKDKSTENKDVVAAWGIGSQVFRAERERSSAQLTLQMAPTDNLGVTVDYFRFELDNPHVNHNFLTVTDRGAGATNVVNNAAGGTASATVEPAYASIIYNPVVRHAVNMVTDVLNLSANYEGDNYEVSGVVGRSTSDGGTQAGSSSWWIPATDEGGKIDDPAYPNGQGSVDGGFSYDATGPYQVQLTSLDAANASQFKHAQEANYQTTLQKHEVSYAQGDVTLNLDFDIITAVSFGVKYNTSDFERIGTKRNPAEVLGFVPGGDSLANWTDGTFTNLHSQSSGNTLNSYARLDEDKWWAFMTDKFNNGELIAEPNLGTTFSVEEDILAVYVQADFSGDIYRGNFGYRYVGTEQTSAGFANDKPFKDTVTYNNFLPSVNVAVDLADDVILRMAASQVLARNNYSDLKPGLAINASLGTANGGNPDLVPFESDQFDIAVEWYFAPASMVAAALFNKEVSNAVFSVTTTEYLADCGAEQSQWSNCQVTRPTNSGEGSVTGLELQLQHAFDNGFGFLTNYTYVDSEMDGPKGSSMVPGVSENSFNTSVFFENDDVSARVAFNWRDEWIGAGSSQVEQNDEYKQVDASLTWHAMENLDITVEGVNLTNEVVESYDTNYNLTQNTVEFGSRYYLSASYRF